MVEIGPNLKNVIEAVVVCGMVAVCVVVYNWRMTKTAKYEYFVEDETDEVKVNSKENTSESD